MVCDKDGLVSGADGSGIQNQKQEPHTKMWGKTGRFRMAFSELSINDQQGSGIERFLMESLCHGQVLGIPC